MSILEADQAATQANPAQPSQWLSWSHCTAGGLDPAAARGVGGVYLIWQGDGADRRWLYVGQGADIAARLAEYDGDPRVRMFCGNGQGVHFAWAAVATLNRQGVACYLNQALAPLVSEPLPAARALSVNLPG